MDEDNGLYEENEGYNYNVYWEKLQMHTAKRITPWKLPFLIDKLTISFITNYNEHSSNSMTFN